MTLEFILKCAISSMVHGHHEPHSFSAWVKGRGYVGKGETIVDGATTIHDRADYLRQLEHTAQSDLDNLDTARGYAEPGYSDPAKCVVFGNWNHWPKNLDKVLERAGYTIEWSDEWNTCEDCYRAFRTQPNGWDWRPVYSWDGYCSLVCRDCLQERYPTSEDCE